MKKKMSFATKTKYLEHRGVDVASAISTKNLKFEESSRRERWSMDQIIPYFTKNGKLGYDYTYRFTPYWDYDSYDMIYQNLDDGSIKSTWLIECKIREKHYPKLMLECKKLRKIKEMIMNDNTSIMYINFTPEGTFCWNITKMEKDLPEEMSITYIQCPKETMGDTSEVNKAVILLDTKFAKKIDFIYNEQEYLRAISIKPTKTESICPLFGKL